MPADWKTLNADAPAKAKTALNMPTVWVEDHRDGVLNDAQIIDAAFAAAASGSEIRFGQGVTYNISQQLEIDVTAKSDLLVNGQGATLQITAGVTSTAIRLRGTYTEGVTTLTAAVTAGDSQLTVSDVGSAQAGDLVRLISDGEVFNTDRGATIGRFKEELARVKAVPNSTTLELEGRLWNTYSITGYTVTVDLVRPVRNLTVRDVNVVGAGPAYVTKGFSVAHFDNASMINCTARSLGHVGLQFYQGFNATFASCTASDCDATGLGYGMAFLRLHHGRAIDCHGARNRHSLESHTSRDTAYISCVAEDDRGTGLSTHGSDTHKVINCIARNCGGGIIVRGTRNLICGNHIIGSKAFADDDQTGYHGIVVGASVSAGTGPSGVGIAATYLVVEDNYIELSGPAWGSGDVSGVRVYSPLVDARITGNVLKGINGTAISARGDYNTRVLIADNTIDCTDQYQPTDLYWAIALKATNSLETCINTDIDIDRNTIIGPVADSAIYVGGGPLSTNRSNNIRIRWNKIGQCGDLPIHLDDGYFDDNVSIVGNETLDVQAVKLTVANWNTPPYIGDHGYGRIARPLGVGQELGARLRPGLYYGPAGDSQAAGTVTNRLSAVPWFVSRRVTIDRLAVNITAGSGSGGSQGRVGIYADRADGYGGYPGDLVSGSEGTVATDAVAFVEATVNVTLNPGLYWLVFVPQTAAPSATHLVGANQMVGHALSGLVAGRCGYVQTGVSGALPNAFTASEAASSGGVFVQARVSSSSTL